MTEEIANAETIEKLATEESQESAEPAPAPEEVTEPTRNRGAERRIKQLTARSRESESELAKTREELDALKKRVEEFSPSNPKPDKFDFVDDDGEVDIEQYTESMVDWKMSQQTPAEPQDTQPETYESDMMLAGKDKYEDFEEVVTNDNVPFTQEIIEYVESLDNAEEILYQLAKDPGKVYDLRVNPSKIQAEVAKIGAGILPAKPRPEAPEPIEPALGGGDNSGAVDVSKMTTAQYIAHRRKARK